VVKTVLMSIKPTYARRIFDGTKRFELRRAPVKLALGDRVIVYESAPTKAVVGFFWVVDVVRDGPSVLWRRHRNDFGIDRGDFFAYFEGKETAHAIQVGALQRIDPVPLDTLRERIANFRPPQSYMQWHHSLDPLLRSPRLAGKTKR
jgi:predicted transcriptional regulator